VPTSRWSPKNWKRPIERFQQAARDKRSGQHRNPPAEPHHRLEHTPGGAVEQNVHTFVDDTARAISKRHERDARLVDLEERRLAAAFNASQSAERTNDQQHDRAGGLDR